MAHNAGLFDVWSLGFLLKHKGIRKAHNLHQAWAIDGKCSDYFTEIVHCKTLCASVCGGHREDYEVSLNLLWRDPAPLLWSKLHARPKYSARLQSSSRSLHTDQNVSMTVGSNVGWSSKSPTSAPGGCGKSSTSAPGDVESYLIFSSHGFWWYQCHTIVKYSTYGLQFIILINHRSLLITYISSKRCTVGSFSSKCVTWWTNTYQRSMQFKSGDLE